MFVIDRHGKSFLIYFSIGSAVLAGALIWFFLRHLERTYQEEGETLPVLIAARYLPRDAVIKPAYFRMAKIPKAYVEPGAVNDFDILESSPGHPRFRALIPLPEGAQLVQRDMASLEQADALSQKIPDNLVAVSFGVDRLRGLAGNVIPGDLIDVLHTPKSQDGSPSPGVTGTLFEAVRVIAVGKTPEGDPEETTVLTVALNPAAAVRLAQTRENEILSLVLRAPGDEQGHGGLQ